MYLRQSNKWKDYVLQEGIEDIGLPPEVAQYLRRQNETYGPVSNKHLTWIGTLIKAVKSSSFFDAGIYQTIIEDIVGLGAFPNTPEGEEAWSQSLEFFKDWYIRHSGDRGRPTIVDVKGLKRSARKILKRVNAPDKAIKQLESYLDHRMMRGTQDLQRFYAPIMELLSKDPASYDDLRKELGFDEFAITGPTSRTLRDASDIARDILSSPVKAEDQVIHTFDNGYFWYDIRSHVCSFEQQKMGHCGQAERGQLYSLRSGEKRRNIKPMITLAFGDGNVYQIKAKANKAPPQDLYPYIDWFIENMGVKRILETGMHSSDGVGFAEMREYLKQKHPEVKLEDSWVDEATELIEQFAPGMASDSQTFQEVGWPSLGAEEASFLVRHQAFWPVKDIIVDEETYRLRWEIRQDAQNIADNTLYPNPRVGSVDVFARGVQDSEAAMIRVSLLWDETFEPRDLDDEEDVKEELGRLTNYLDEMQDVSGYLVSTTAAPEEAEFDYNGFHERVQKRLEEYGVYRDLAGEIDAEEERDKSGQMDLPLQEQRIIQRWSKIIQ